MWKLVRRESCRKAFLRSGVIEMKQLSGALEQIGGQVAGLIVNPARSEVERDFLARGAYFDGAETIQNLFNFVYATFWKQQKKVVVAEPRGNVRAAARFFQAAAEFLERGVYRRLTVSRAEVRELIHVDGGETQRRVLAPRASYFFSEMLLERRARVQARHRVKANRFQYLLWDSWRIYCQACELPSQTPKRPLPIDQPAIENENQTQCRPARLIGSDFVKIIRMPKEGMNRGK